MTQSLLSKTPISYEYQESPGELRSLNKLVREYIKDKKERSRQRWRNKNEQRLSKSCIRFASKLNIPDSSSNSSRWRYNKKHSKK